MKLLAGAIGVLALLVGGSWLFQPLGIVHLRPILCFANCATMQGRSSVWAFGGSVVTAMGLLAIAFASRWR